MTSQSTARPSLLMALSSSLEAAHARGLKIGSGDPVLAIRGGRYAAGFTRCVDVLGAVLIGSPTRAECYEFERALEDAAAMLGTTREIVAWVCAGFDHDEDPPTLEEGYDPAVVDAHAIGAALRRRYCHDDCES